MRTLCELLAQTSHSIFWCYSYFLQNGIRMLIILRPHSSCMHDHHSLFLYTLTSPEQHQSSTPCWKSWGIIPLGVSIKSFDQTPEFLVSWSRWLTLVLFTEQWRGQQTYHTVTWAVPQPSQGCPPRQLFSAVTVELTRCEPPLSQELFIVVGHAALEQCEEDLLEGRGWYSPPGLSDQPVRASYNLGETSGEAAQSLPWQRLA